MPQLNVHALRAALNGQPFGHTIHYHSSVPSTMPLARTLAEGAANPAHISGSVVVADEQTAGRGRLDRRWETPPERALLVSLVVAGAHLPERPAQLPMIAGLAVLDAVTQAVSLRQFRLKWPNDLVALLPDGPVKVAGLLAESSLDSQGIRYAVLGIGVNVNQQADELPTPRPGGLPPASLYTLCGRDFAREELLIALCRSLSGLLAAPNHPTAEEVHARWQAALINLGRDVIVYDGRVEDTQWRGRALGTDEDGALLVEDETGQRVAVTAGDVSVEFCPPTRSFGVRDSGNRPDDFWSTV
ncbi:MAG: biotin--[acetyl-CoA-carboxylase] ligase [Chloroflexi bacterium]|nr:biotin--[acetyl-CoA-carboxylase] ligase [Chloroflexota bacterium]